MQECWQASTYTRTCSKPDVSIQSGVLILERKPKELIDVETPANKIKDYPSSWPLPIMSPHDKRGTKPRFGIEKGMRSLRNSNNCSMSGATERLYMSASLPERKWLWVLLIRRYTLRG